MSRITLLLLLLVVAYEVQCMPTTSSLEENPHQVEKRSIFGLSAFVVSLLNTILGISWLMSQLLRAQNLNFQDILGAL